MCDTSNEAGGRKGVPLARRSVLTGLSVGAAGAALSTVAGASSASADPSPTRRALPPNRGTELFLLGTAAGPPPEPDRVGISSVLRVDGKSYLVDCGRSSVSQYYNLGLRYADLDSIFLTHLHADHICEYYNVFLLAGWGLTDDNDALTQTVPVYGPGPAGALRPPFHGGTVTTVSPEDPTPGLADMTRRLVDAYAYTSNLFIRDSGSPDPRTLVDVHEIKVPDVGADPLGQTAPPMKPFHVMSDERVSVSAILVPHGPVFPAFAYRFDTDHGSVVFSGDTSLSDNVVRLAKGADVLVHEAIDLQALGTLPPAAEDHLKASHTSIDDVGGVAERAGVRTLVLSHLVPSAHSIVPDQVWRRRAQAGFRGQVLVGEDGDRFRVRRGSRLQPL